MSAQMLVAAAMLFIGVAAVLYGIFLHYEVDDREHLCAANYVFAGMALVSADIVVLICAAYP